MTRMSKRQGSKVILNEALNLNPYPYHGMDHFGRSNETEQIRVYDTLAHNYYGMGDRQSPSHQTKIPTLKLKIKS
jgi:hypothetical protein